MGKLTPRVGGRHPSDEQILALSLEIPADPSQKQDDRRREYFVLRHTPETSNSPEWFLRPLSFARVNPTCR